MGTRAILTDKEKILEKLHGYDYVMGWRNGTIGLAVRTFYIGNKDYLNGWKAGVIEYNFDKHCINAVRLMLGLDNLYPSS